MKVAYSGKPREDNHPTAPQSVSMSLSLLLVLLPAALLFRLTLTALTCFALAAAVFRPE